MADQPKTKIVFSGGAEVQVTAPVADVEKQLSRGAGFMAMRAIEGGKEVTVHIAPEQVAYILELPEYESVGFS
jgi:hypothetical protein